MRAGPVAEAQQLGNLRGEEDAEYERGRRVRHLRPEDRADEPAPVLGILLEEVEADEAEVGAAANHDHGDGHDRHEQLDAAVVPRRDVARVERQHEDGEEAGRKAADPVDRGVPAQLEQLGRERARASGGLRLRLVGHGRQGY